MSQRDEEFEHLTIAEAPAEEFEEVEQEEPKEREELPVAELLDYLRKVLEEGTARRLILRDRNERVLLDLPLAPTALFGAFGLLLMPLWMRIVTVVGLLSSVTIEILREVNDENSGKEGESAKERKQRVVIEQEEADKSEMV